MLNLKSIEIIRDAIIRRWARIQYEIKTMFEPKQKPKILDFIKNEKFALIILDSCRYDIFSEEVEEFLEGDLEHVYTHKTYTIQYFKETWDGSHQDLTYFTGLPAPTDYAFKQKGIDFTPSRHIGQFVHLWDDCENKELGAVPPEFITSKVLKNKTPHMIIHYVQPHAPYIGDYRLRDNNNQDFEENTNEIYEKIGRHSKKDKVISDSELRRAYRSNLQRVLKAVRQLVINLDRPIIITADHGEMLGEKGRYIHGGLPTEDKLCKLPWFKIDSSMLGNEDGTDTVDRDIMNDNFNDQDVHEQLEDLGYM
jgi:hypothetical protein